MKIHVYTKGVFLIAILVLQSCIPTQDVREPDKTLPVAYALGNSDTLNVGNMRWSDYFEDPYLQQLIDTALIRNQELNIVLQNIAVAQNEVRTRRGEYLPFIGIQGGSEVDKASKFTRNGAVEEHLTIGEETPFPDPLKNYQLGLSASWELDIWKKLRNAKKAAVYEYLASVEGKNYVVTNLVAEVAKLYYELMVLDNQLDFVAQNLEIQQNALKMVRLQKQAARATELAVRRFEAEVLKNQSHLFEIRQEITVTENQLNFLLGRNPQPIVRNSAAFIDGTYAPVASGLPAQILQNRPDVRKAELELEGAKLNVKVARASFFPTVGLKAGLGFESFKSEFLFTSPEALVYNAVGDLVAPIINRNGLKAAFNTATSRQIQALYEYERAILNGFVEISNQLTNIENLNASYDRKVNQVKALNESIELANQLFRSARAEYLEVLLTQREALEARMELVETRKDQMNSRIDLYRALGGGWK
ncbi:MAG: hypothetical protein RLZZ241_184 [Bacteroidota bacterium]|jgi:NodT family efflux transporter outer membrane factor (OMF) lipoprotein